jgi:rhodanese-related sulfurtransferase
VTDDMTQHRHSTPSKSLPRAACSPPAKRSIPSSNFITAETLTSVFDKNTTIIDCRFTEEFNAGHIKNAINFPSGIGASAKLFRWLRKNKDFFPGSFKASKTSKSRSILKKTVEEEGEMKSDDMIPKKPILVLHCEFSQIRAPRMAKELLRKFSESPNNASLEVYVLKGGYSEFFAKFGPRFCDGGYSSMHDLGLELELDSHETASLEDSEDETRSTIRTVRGWEEQDDEEIDNTEIDRFTFKISLDNLFARSRSNSEAFAPEEL